MGRKGLQVKGYSLPRQGIRTTVKWRWITYTKTQRRTLDACERASSQMQIITPRSHIYLLSRPEPTAGFLTKTKMWADGLFVSRKDRLEKSYLPPVLSSGHTTTTNSVICEIDGVADSWWWEWLIKRPAQASNTPKSKNDRRRRSLTIMEMILHSLLWSLHHIAFFPPSSLNTRGILSCSAMNLVTEENGLINKDSLKALLSLMHGKNTKDLRI